MLLRKYIICCIILLNRESFSKWISALQNVQLNKEERFLCAAKRVYIYGIDCCRCDYGHIDRGGSSGRAKNHSICAQTGMHCEPTNVS